MTAAPPLLEANVLTKHFPVTRGLLGRPAGVVHAVDGVSFSVARGETLSVVGESGCGKSTLGRMILRLTDPTAGEIYLAGERIDRLSGRRLRPLRRRVQVVFQDPFSSLNPRMRVRDIIAEPIRNFGLARNRSELDDRVAEMMDRVRLPRDAMRRRPHEFSGGQRQRVAIARAIVLQPRLVVLDEPTSALDRSVQAQIVDLLRNLQQRHGLAYLFISHDLAVARALAHRVVVLRAGRVVEEGAADQVFGAPREAYTRALMKASFALAVD